MKKNPSKKNPPHPEKAPFTATQLQHWWCTLEKLYEEKVPHDPRIAEVCEGIAFHMELMRSYSSAIDCYQQALDIWMACGDDRVVDAVTCLKDIAECYEKMGNGEKAKEFLKKAYDLCIEKELDPSVEREIMF